MGDAAGLEAARAASTRRGSAQQLLQRNRADRRTAVHAGHTAANRIIVGSKARRTAWSCRVNVWRGAAFTCMHTRGSQGSDPRLLRPTMTALLDRTCGERPRA